MKKRLLNRLAQAGYFNNANGALYAATRRALRKPLSRNYANLLHEPDHEAPAKFDASNSAVNTAPKASPRRAEKRDRKKISLA